MGGFSVQAEVGLWQGVIVSSWCGFATDTRSSLAMGHKKGARWLQFASSTNVSCAVVGVW